MNHVIRQRDQSHGCHGMTVFFRDGLSAPMGSTSTADPTFRNRNWPRSGLGLWISRWHPSGRLFFVFFIHCCFIQTAPKLAQIGYILKKWSSQNVLLEKKAVEGLLFKWKIAESATPNPLGPLPWRQDALPAPRHQVSTESWMWCQWLRRFERILVKGSWEPSSH